MCDACLSNRDVSFLCIQNAATAAAPLCCDTAVASALPLLLHAAVRHRVCRMPKFVAASLNLTPECFYLHSNAIYFLFTPWQYCVAFKASFACILRNYGHARSQGGRQPAAVKPPMYHTWYT